MSEGRRASGALSTPLKSLGVSVTNFKPSPSGEDRMRLPRRVPWESLAELDQIFSWIYTDENDLESKQRAVNRVGYEFRSMPYFMEWLMTFH